MNMTKQIHRSFNQVRNELANVGLLDNGAYLDLIDLVPTSKLTSIFSGAHGFVFDTKVDFLAKLAGFKEGVIYITTNKKNMHLSKAYTLTDYPMVNGGHYNGEGLVIMGEDFAKAILAVEPPRPSTPEQRTFNSADGKKSFLAVLTKYDQKTGMVSVRKSNGRTTKFKIELLSEKDQEYVKKQSK
jgi:hypothetical protein